MLRWDLHPAFVEQNVNSIGSIWATSMQSLGSPSFEKEKVFGDHQLTSTIYIERSF